jgi:hypothetical protein
LAALPVTAIAHTIGVMLVHPRGDDARHMKQPTGSVRYEFRIRGLLGDTLLGAFPELHAEVGAGVTVLAGPLPDQSALHGVLTQIERLGLELLSVSSVEDGRGTSERP